MSLKFQEVAWDDRDLMYVEFIANGQKMRWYPRWKEVADILHSAWLTEGAFNGSRWRDYFDTICAEILTKDLIRKVAARGNFNDFPSAEVQLSVIFRRLKEITTSEGYHAKA